MDPPHVTEFASQRYFDKLKQLSDSKTQPQDAGSHQHDGPVVQQSSTFILPIGKPRLSDQVLYDHPKSTDKRRPNFSLRSILPSRNPVEHDHQRRISTETTKPKTSAFPPFRKALNAPSNTIAYLYLVLEHSTSCFWLSPMSS